MASSSRKAGRSVACAGHGEDSRPSTSGGAKRKMILMAVLFCAGSAVAQNGSDSVL